MSAIELVLEPWTDRVSGSGQIILNRCPFCDAGGHLYVSVRSGLWICFRCDSKGNLAKLVAELSGITYAEAEIEIKSAGVRRSTFRPPVIEEGEPIEVDLPSEFVPCYKEGRFSIPRYLTERRIERGTIRDWGIGYCLRGRYKNRIVFPIETAGERTFVTRATLPGMFPSYLGPEVDEGRGRRFLPGWKFARAREPVVICEGLFDALRIYQAGFKPLALLGKGLGITQRKRILELTPSRVIVMLDSDAWSAGREIANELSSFIRDVRAVALDEGDPGDRSEADVRRLLDSAGSVEAADRERVLSKLAGLTY
jgi:DNA primase